MGKGRQAKYASHLPVLELLFKYSNIKDVFEYGCGSYSTKFFIDNAISVTSIEMNSLKWYNNIKLKLMSDRLNLLCMIGETEGIEYFNKVNKRFDLVFVDGDARLDCVKSAFGKSDIIAVHDLGLRHFGKKKDGWTILNAPDSYKIIVMRIKTTPTTIYTSSEGLFNQLKKYECVVIKE
jgi:hypothetical protein